PSHQLPVAEPPSLRSFRVPHLLFEIKPVATTGSRACGDNLYSASGQDLLPLNVAHAYPRFCNDILYWSLDPASRRAGVAPASATAQDPRRENGSLRRSLQNGFHATQQRYHGRLRIAFSRGRHNHDCVSLLKVA